MNIFLCYCVSLAWAKLAAGRGVRNGHAKASKLFEVARSQLRPNVESEGEIVDAVQRAVKVEPS